MQTPTAQTLLLPYPRQALLGGYKTEACLRLYGYLHTGLDIACTAGGSRVRASGRGTVVAAGWDGLYGWGLAVLYPDCLGADRSVAPLIARYLHLAALLVRTGDTVAAGDPIAREGSIGTGTPHLHLELDADLSCPCRTPQIGEGHAFWRGGTDTTVDPALWLWQGEGQTIAAGDCDPAWLGFAAQRLLSGAAKVHSLYRMQSQ